ncbi:Maleylacetate reductase [Shimia sp. SK013]|uniref:maleylacetate reductase n=1 Tax=Shimia sp. SK013 TaxID=1389006 RepID=UPI0006B6251A|nr:maleylacetate reductase [Shimia sp. SK013]KPA21295.1 Maleylacetate reductase [Shimia sp. SK013]
MNQFSYKSGAARIEFGRGNFGRVRDLVLDLSCTRAVVLATEQQGEIAETATKHLGSVAGGSFAGAVMHTPIEVTEGAAAYCDSVQADCLVSVGGGSTTGLGKAISYRTGLPHIVVPTTYAGSEVTPILGQTEQGLKTTINDTKVLPTAVIYDPDLTDTLPLKMSIVSGLNAMAHAAEALYAQNRNPISSMLAVEGLSAMKDGLGQIASDPQSKSGRDSALYGAWLCGTVLGQVGMALHHKICHTLGGSFDMPHAETHAVMLPHTIGYNAQAVPDVLQPIATLFGGEPGPALYEYAKSVGSPVALKDLGFKEEDLDRAASIAASNPYWNPRPIDEAGLRVMLQNAFDGATPPHTPQ